jgi:hypothetical protein
LGATMKKKKVEEELKVNGKWMQKRWGIRREEG